jgi:protein-tyrosine phosphatase
MGNSTQMGEGQLISASCLTNGAPSIMYQDEHYTMEHSWISGGSFPGYKCILNYLHSIDVRLIVTLTIEELKPGLNINHVPFSHEHSQWMQSDITQEDLDKFEIVHIPIADNGYPTPENAEKLIEVAKKFVVDYSQKKESPHNYPHHKAYFHCWGGQGRTSTAIIYILMNLYNRTFEDAYFRIYHRNKNCLKLSETQIKFLKGKLDEITEQEIKDNEPIVKTPRNYNFV